jgi:DNA-binding MarR family transcriptional regulator
MARKGSGVTQKEYEALAAFREALRDFLAFSEQAARAVGLMPRQHQALLAIRGEPPMAPLTIGGLATRLRLRHHSAVGLVDRLESLGLLRRKIGAGDRRRVYVALTPRGERTLERLTGVHREELRQLGPRLDALLRSFVSR